MTAFALLTAPAATRDLVAECSDCHGFLIPTDGGWKHLTDRCATCWVGGHDAPDADCFADVPHERNDAAACLGSEPVRCDYAPCTRAVNLVAPCDACHGDCCGSCCGDDE